MLEAIDLASSRYREVVERVNEFAKLLAINGVKDNEIMAAFMSTVLTLAILHGSPDIAADYLRALADDIESGDGTGCAGTS